MVRPMAWYDPVVKFFQFRDIPSGRFRPPPANDTEKPVRGEVAFADPRRLFPGTQPWAQYNPSHLVGSKGLYLFDEMRRDDQVKSALAFKKYSCIQTGWQVSSPEGKAKNWNVTQFVDWVLRNMDPLEVGSPTLDNDLYEILSCLDYGYSVTEKIWEEITEGPWKGHVGLKALKTRAPWGLVFSQDEFGNLLPDGIVQQINTVLPGGRLPRSKFVIMSYQSQFGNPYGVSDLEAAYTAWWSKHNAQKWLAMLLERLGIPPIFGLYNPTRYVTPTGTGRTAIDDLKTIFQNLQAATFGLIPRPDKDALDFWSPDLAGNATRVFLPSLEYFNKGISRAILMPDLLGMTHDSSQGSYARARVHFDVFLLVVTAIRTQLEAIVMNHQVIKPLVDINFPGVTDYPQWSFLPMTDDQRKDMLSLWVSMVEKGVVTNLPEDEAHIRELIKFPDMDNPNLEPPSSKMYPPPVPFGATEGPQPGVEGPGGMPPKNPPPKPAPTSATPLGGPNGKKPQTVPPPPPRPSQR
jgi:hypothetical protein